MLEKRLSQLDPNAPPVAPAVGAGPSLRPGTTGPRVDRLAAQLTARGLLAADAYHGQVDDAVQQAVRAFQTSVGINADGVAGEATVAAMDRGPAEAIAAIKATLNEMHEFTSEMPHEFFLVNIPSQTGYLVQRGVVAMAMRLAVGRPSRPTPLLEDKITDVILNPTWTAPTTVLAKDKLPSLRRTGHPGIEGATVYLDGVEVDPAAVDWSLIEPERLRIVQSPGNQNALGRFKFNLTNNESIYLHDTNDHSVFARQGRAISSGCVRLAEPRRLAEMLLGREGWTPERITKAVETSHTQGIGLSRPLPVRIVYWLATVEDDDTVHIHRDVYGRSAKVVPTVAEAPSIKVTAATPTSPHEARPAPATVAHPSGQMAVPAIPRAVVTPAAQRVSQPVSLTCGEHCGLGLY